MPLSLDIVIIIVSIAFAAFFAGAETALTAASRARMHALEMAGEPRAALVTRLIGMRGRLISAMLLGGQFVTIGSSAIATSVLLDLSATAASGRRRSMMTALIVVFGEVMPKTIAIAYPDRVALRDCAARPVFCDGVWPGRACGRGTGPVHPAGLRAVARPTRTRAFRATRLMGAVDILHRDGEVERSERDMFGGLLELSEVPVADVMVHRTKMRLLDADLPPEEVVREAIKSPYTRLPLWRGDPDNIIGILHAKDLLRALCRVGGRRRQAKIADIALDPWFIPESTTLRDQLQAFLRRKTHSALVVDEYGVVQGLVTLEDIIEEIVGDIRDEHDEAVQGLRKQRDGSVVVDGGATIRDLNRAMAGTCPTRRRRPWPASSSTRRAPSPSRGRPSPFTASASRCCASSATGSPPCGSCRWRRANRESRPSRTARSPPRNRAAGAGLSVRIPRSRAGGRTRSNGGAR